MTRKEQKIAALRDREIKIAASNYVEENSVNGYEAISSHRDSFIEGANWADKHPNLESLWHNASEEPQIGSNIVVVDKMGQWWDIQPYDGEYDDCNGLTGWRCCVVHYNNIQSWAYIRDLLPKGGELVNSVN